MIRKLDDEVDVTEDQQATMPLTPDDEVRILETTLAVFRGRTKGWVVLNWLLTAASGGVALWAGSAFFEDGTTRDAIFYATVFLLSAMAVSILKIWFWMEMNRYTHAREIKRLELQVAKIVQMLRERPVN